MTDEATIETPRLRLRRPDISDAARIAGLYAEPDVTRFISGRPSTREQSWGRLLRQIGHWAAFGYGFWIVERRADGQFVGEVGFGEFRRDLEPRIEGIPEAGWVLLPAAAGQGFATEAMRAALAWLDLSGVYRSTYCIVDPEHAASLRVASKLGYRDAVSARHAGLPAVVLFRTSTPAPGTDR
jgi:RimJ/RimL family protein N-acetyltransferase